MRCSTLQVCISPFLLYLVFIFPNFFSDDHQVNSTRPIFSGLTRTHCYIHSVTISCRMVTSLIESNMSESMSKEYVTRTVLPSSCTGLIASKVTGLLVQRQVIGSPPTPELLLRLKTSLPISGSHREGSLFSGLFGSHSQPFLQ